MPTEEEMREMCDEMHDELKKMRDYVYRQEAHGLVVESLPVDDLRQQQHLGNTERGGDVVFPKLDRLGDWDRFSYQVLRHIEEYTIPQYQSSDGDDQVQGFTAHDCIQNMKRYINRFGVGTRGPAEELRDILKIAHYASFAYEKRAKELGVKELYSRELSNNEMCRELMKKRGDTK